MSFSDYLENRVLDHIFSKVTYTGPIISVGLHITDPGDTGGGEVANANGYERVLTLNIDWNAAAAGVITNFQLITFPEVVTSNWGLITHFALYDAWTWGGGNMLISGLIIPNYILAVGSVARFEPGELAVTLV